MNNSDSIKNFSHVGIGRIITIVFQSLFYLVIAALLDPETYGELIVILLTGAPLSASWLGSALTTQGHNW